MTATMPPPSPRWPAVVAERAFPPAPRTAFYARAFVREMATGWHLPTSVVDDAVAIVSEMIGNVIRHARTPVVIGVTYDGRTLLLTSTDGEPETPLVHRPAAVAESGRGLLLIDSLADLWGVQTTPVGKRMWATLTAPVPQRMTLPPAPPDAPAIDPEAPIPDDPGPLLPDSPTTLPPPPVEPSPGPGPGSDG